MAERGGARRRSGGRKSGPSRFQTLIAALGAAVVTTLIAPLDTIENVELSLLDARFRFRGPLPARSDIVIVPIDQTSESDFDHPFPWDRRYHARLVDNLARAGARLIVFDIEFTEEKDPGANAEFAAAVARAGNVILAGKTPESTARHTAQGVVPPIPALADAAWGWGLVDISFDRDEAVRRYPIAREFMGRQFASLGFEVLKAYEGLPESTRIVDLGRSVRLGPHEVPRFDRLTMLIDYGGAAGTYPHYSYSNVVDDANFDLPRLEADTDIFDLWLEEGVFRNKVVLIGATSPEQHDLFRTPFFATRGARNLTPGVEIHAHALATVLDSRYIFRPGHTSPFFQPALALLAALLTCVVAARFGPIGGLGGAIVLGLGHVALSFWLFVSQRWWLDITGPVLAIGLAYSAQSTWMVVAEQKDKRRIRGMFSQYVPPQVVAELIRRPELLTLGGEERVLSVLFSDVESFTTISESMTPRALAEHLNRYLTAMSDVIMKHGGIVDKFEGDAIMAEFGAPVPVEDHARAACLAALEMQEQLLELQKVWIAEGVHPWKARVGVNTGQMIVGNMGSQRLFDYTVLGDNVNLGARLESSNKAYGTRIMVSEATLAAAGRDFFVARELDDLVVKGKTRAVKVFELVGTRERPPTEEKQAVLAAYERGFRAAAAERWDEAAGAFEEALRLDPADGPSAYHLQRVNRHRSGAVAGAGGETPSEE